MQRLRSVILLTAAVVLMVLGAAGARVWAQGSDRLTPLQRRIEEQKRRLGSSQTEERRDALMKLGAMKHRDASRAAVAALTDQEAIVRVTAAHAITSLPPAEAASLLAPLLKDKLEFVRREGSYALGETQSRSAVQALVDLLTIEKEVSVRSAAVLALGQIKDESAVPTLTQMLAGISPNKKSKKREDEFVMRSAAQALGEIRSRAGVPALIATLTNETGSVELRRTAATALGLIGDTSAVPALQSALADNDPYLSGAAREALRQLRLRP